jgi:hypothetical protein
MVVCGTPGVGKSTFLLAQAKAWAGRTVTAAGEVELELLPVHVDLREHVYSSRGLDLRDLMLRVLSRARHGYHIPAEELDARLGVSHCILLLLDGLELFGDAALNIPGSDFVAELCNGFTRRLGTRLKVIVTWRGTASVFGARWTGHPSSTIYDLLPFTEQQVLVRELHYVGKSPGCPQVGLGRDYRYPRTSQLLVGPADTVENDEGETASFAVNSELREDTVGGGYVG